MKIEFLYYNFLYRKKMYVYLVDGSISLMAFVCSSTVGLSAELVLTVLCISSFIASSVISPDFDEDILVELFIVGGSGESVRSDEDDFVNAFRSLNFRIFRYKNSCLRGKVIV